MNRQISKRGGIWLIFMALCTACLLFQGSVSAEENRSWKEVYTRSGDCRISFPAVPQMVQQSLKLAHSGQKLNYDVYLAPYLDRGVCLLLIAEYPSSLPGGQEMVGLEGLLRGIVSHNPENELVFAKVAQIQGFPAINFLVQSGKNYFRGQAVMVGKRLYMIAMEGQKHHFEEPTFQQFLQSFQLISS